MYNISEFYPYILESHITAFPLGYMYGSKEVRIAEVSLEEQQVSESQILEAEKKALWVT